MAILAFASGTFGVLLAAGVLFRGRRASLANWFFFAGMLCLALEVEFAALSLRTAVAHEIIRWQTAAQFAKALMPGFWLCYSLTYSRGNYREFLIRWRHVVALCFLIPLILTFAFQEDFFRDIRISESGEEMQLDFGTAGKALNFVFLVSVILILMNLEKTLRTAVGTMRWRIKFVVVGLCVIFGAKIYVTSQALLYSGINPSLSLVESAGLLIGCALITISFLRAGLAEIDVYPSHTFLFSSLTIILIGIYLVIVGLLAKLVGVFGGNSAFPITAFFVLVAVVGLAILLLSDRARQTMQRFVSRHFKRPLYDYRKVWNLFTEKTARATDERSLCATAAKLISDTFSVLSVTIWLFEQKQLKFAASTTLPSSPENEETATATELSPIIAAFQTNPHPFDIDDATEPWAKELREKSIATFQKGGHRICVPIVAGDTVLGMILLADRVSGIPFTLEELDLLKCIANQIGASLLGIQLTQQLMFAKEHEAVKSVSTFFVHDLKNAASALSLMLRNLPVHFDDPTFRQDVQRGLAKTVDHMNHLINRLSLLRQQPEIKAVTSDLNKLVTTALSKWPPIPNIEISSNLKPVPALLLDPELIQNVITNLMLNARDAVGQAGQIRIETGQQNGWAILTVSDDGCGMSPDFVRDSLFRPFKTTKKDGTGIGMFQCKTVVEAHRGKMEVDSELGKGSSFRVLLPIALEFK